MSARVYFDALLDGEVADIAQALLADGYECDALMDWVFWGRGRGSDLELFLRSPHVGGPPSPQAAALALMGYYCQRIVEGHLEPYEGAKTIGLVLASGAVDLNDMTGVSLFRALASEYDDFRGMENVLYYGASACVLKREAIVDEMVALAAIHASGVADR